MPPVATVRDVSKLYGRFPALRHITFDLLPGRCYVLLGENGAGKSTLLRVLAGLLRPTLGELRVLDQPPYEVRGQIGYMSHAAMLYDELTARENLAYTATLYAGHPCLAPDEVLRLVGLDPLLTRPVRSSCCSTSPSPTWIAPAPSACSGCSPTCVTRAAPSF
jgi:ABC-type multidrug transport system ATPase subunit